MGAERQPEGMSSLRERGSLLIVTFQVEEEAAKYMAQMKLIVQGTPGKLRPKTNAR